MPRLHLRITGRVQGVSFRWYAKQQADKLGIADYAENLPDGSVEILAEGTDAALAQFTAWCKRGPPHAEVEHVEIAEQGAAGGIRGFRYQSNGDSG